MSIRDDRSDTADQLFAHGRVHRYRDGSGIEASEETGDKVQARGAQQQHPFAGSALPLQGGGDRAGPDVEFAVGQLTMFLPIHGEVECDLVSMAFGYLPHQVYQSQRSVL